MRRWTSSRSQSAASAPTTSSLNAIWASGPLLLAAKLRWVGRTASRVRPSMIAIVRIACAFGSIACQAPMRSSRRRGPSAIATARSRGAPAAGGGAGSTSGDRDAAPNGVLDRGRQRKARDARAGNDDVEDGRRFGHCGRLLRPHCRTDEESHTGSWAAAPFWRPDSIFSRRCGAIPSCRAQGRCARRDGWRCGCAQCG